MILLIVEYSLTPEVEMKRFAFSIISWFVHWAQVALFTGPVVAYRHRSVKAGFPLELKREVEYGWLHLLGDAKGALVILPVLYLLVSCLNLLYGHPNQFWDWPWQQVAKLLGH